MKEFIKQISIFLAALVLYFCFSIAYNLYVSGTVIPDIGERRVLIAGDSHPQMSIDPGLFSSAVNISQSAEPYVLTYWKLKKVFETHLPDTLVLGFAPHNLSAFNDYKFSKPSAAPEMFRRSYPIEDFAAIEDKIEIDYFQYFSTIAKQLGPYPKTNHVNYIGRFVNNENSFTNDWKKATQRHYYKEGAEVGVSEVAIQYLDSILVLCADKGVIPVLVGCPVHKDYYENIPSTNLATFNTVMDKYEGEVMILDRSRALYPDSLFYNSDHLNSKGARLFTNRLIQELKPTR